MPQNTADSHTPTQTGRVDARLGRARRKRMSAAQCDAAAWMATKRAVDMGATETEPARRRKLDALLSARSWRTAAMVLSGTQPWPPPPVSGYRIDFDGAEYRRIDTGEVVPMTATAVVAGAAVPGTIDGDLAPQIAEAAQEAES